MWANLRISGVLLAVMVILMPGRYWAEDAPKIAWTRLNGNSLYGVAADKSGSVYVTGDGPGATGTDFLTVKYSSDGTEIWSDMQGSWYPDFAYAIAVDDVGNAYVTGRDRTVDDSGRWLTIKYSPAGTVMWSVTYSGGGFLDEPYDVDVDDAGNVYVTGRSGAGIFDFNVEVIKYDSSGTKLWDKQFDSGWNDVGYGIATDGKSVCVTGNSYGPTGPATDPKGGWTIKMSATDGAWIWSQPFHEADSDYGKSVAIDSNENVYVTGQSYSSFPPTLWDWRTIKYDPDGTVLWSVSINGGESSAVMGRGIAVDMSASVYVTGSGLFSSSYPEMGTFKYSPQGKILWSTTYQLKEFTFTIPEGIDLDDVGNIFVAGRNDTEGGWIVKYTSGQPNTPSQPSGPSTAALGLNYIYSTFTTDPDGDQVKYGWDWNGDGVADEWSGLMASGATDTRSHTWAVAGTYNVMVKAQDSAGAESGWSTVRMVVVSAAAMSLGDAVGNTSLSWSTGGVAGWIGQSTVYFFDNSAAESGPITHNQSSYMETTVTGPGTLTFHWKVSSQADFDCLSFEIGGIEQPGKICGEVGWELQTHSIPSGTHTLRWIYFKDGSVTTGSDAAWVDKVVFTGLLSPEAVGGKLDLGRMLIAPNVLDRSKSGSSLRFYMRGDSGGTVALNVYDESGEFVGRLRTTLDGSGFGEIVYGGEALRGKQLGSGVYWALVEGGGVRDKKRFMIISRERKR